jgi:hypothetical protein
MRVGVVFKCFIFVNDVVVTVGNSVVGEEVDGDEESDDDDEAGNDDDGDDDNEDGSADVTGDVNGNELESPVFKLILGVPLTD